MYMSALRECFRAGGNRQQQAGGETTTTTEASRECVFFERHLELRKKGGNHCHMNCVPVPLDKAAKARKIFEQAADRMGFQWTVLPPPESALDAQAGIAQEAGDGEYYAVHLPDGTILLRKIGRGEPYWMAFGREVLGHLLGCPERTNWQNCLGDQASEEARNAAFKEKFSDFDPMLKEG